MTTLEDARYTGRLRSFDADADPLVFELVAAPDRGTVNVAPSGSFEFIPEPDFHGSVEFSFAVSDGKSRSASARVVVVVEPVNDRPIALSPPGATMDEDTALEGMLEGRDVEGAMLSFAVYGTALNGTVEVQGNGAYEFTPNPNFFGEASFSFVASDGDETSIPAVRRVIVQPVNDRPQIRPIDDVRNRPETYEIRVAIDPQDVDGDVSGFEATSLNPNVVRTRLDAATGVLTLLPVGEGTAQINVSVFDMEFTDSASFNVAISSVQRQVSVDTTITSPDVVLTNGIDVPVQFRLDVNESLFPGDVNDILARIVALEDELQEEPLPRKIWRTLAKATYRGNTLTERQWLHDPVILLNSVGIGFCDDIASAFYQIAYAAGHEGRVWTLGGHVVPEIRWNGEWRMYDPDLGVYYLDDSNDVVGVTQLAAAPTLISAPLNQAVLESRLLEGARPYDPEVADIYATENDNLVWDYYTALPTVPRVMEFTVPPGASVTFPGPWASAPVDLYGNSLPLNANLKVTSPPGWRGTYRLPLLLVTIRGQGRVVIDDVAYDVGSTALDDRLIDRSSFIDEVRVESADTPLELVYLINPEIVPSDGRYDLSLEGPVVGGLTVGR